MNSFKACREKRGLTQKEVAFSLKVSIQAISYWETGERMPSYDKLFQLADLYKTTTDELLGRIPAIEVNPSEVSFSRDELQILFEYRKLSTDNKTNIRSNIQFLLAQQNVEKETRSTTTA